MTEPLHTDDESTPGQSTASIPAESSVPVPATEVPAGASVHRCPYCDRPFRTIRLKTLRGGEVHESAATAAEWEVYEKAQDLESDDLFFFHIKIVIALGALYSMSVIGYTVVIGLGG
jgi:hypothetical protein